MQRCHDRPVTWIEDQAPAHCANDGGEQVAPRQQQNRVKKNSARGQNRWEHEVHREIGPAPEVEVTVDPLTEEQRKNAHRGAPWLTETLPQEVLDCRWESDQNDRGDGDPKTTIFPVSPEVPVTHGEHRVDVVRTTDNEEKHEQTDVIDRQRDLHSFGM